MAWLLAYTTAVLGFTSLLVALPASLQSPPLVRHPVPQGPSPGAEWVVVRSQAGSWFLNGEPTSSEGLRWRLAEAMDQKGSLLFLPSNGRSIAHVAGDLHWLRRHTTRPVSLGVLPASAAP